MLREASGLAALDLTPEEQTALLDELNTTMAQAEEIHRMSLPNEAPAPIQFNPRVPETALPQIRQVFRPGKPDPVQRPGKLESVAFWPITQLAELIRTRKVSAVELTEMFLARRRRYNPKLNCVVTLTAERALEQAGQLDREIANGRYRSQA